VRAGGGLGVTGDERIQTDSPSAREAAESVRTGRVAGATVVGWILVSYAFCGWSIYWFVSSIA
jgi:hypothetical protein